MKNPIKVIDLFAGPGGLGEGFGSFHDTELPNFKIVVSVEKEASAHKTLTLRAFTRQFNHSDIPDEYYLYITGKIKKEELIKLYPDEWKKACNETLGQPTSLGVDNKLIHSKIRSALGDSAEPWVLIGGPPCQAYSLAGRAKNANSKKYVAKEDDRHFLYKEYLEIIKKFRPTVFVMENVKGILSSKPTGEPIFEKILNDLKHPSNVDLSYEIFSLSNKPNEINLFDTTYKPKDFIIKAEDYGIPQSRHRVILVGVLKDIKVNSDDLILDKKSQVSIGELLEGMPRLRSGISKPNDSFDKWKTIVLESIDDAASILGVKKNELIKEKMPFDRGSKFIEITESKSEKLPIKLKKWLWDPNLGGIMQHETRSHMESDIARYSYVSIFGKKHGRSPLLKEFPRHLLPNHKNVHSGKFVDRFKCQVKNMPSKTITSHIAKDSHAFIHFDPMQSRGLTVREAARIQTFPENYFFEGNRTQQYVQVGNAVPPYLAHMIAEKISKLFDGG